MVAALYDASLDAYLPHRWMEAFSVFRRESSRVQAQFENRVQSFQQILHGWHSESKDAELTYRAFPSEIIGNLWGFGYPGGSRARGGGPRRYKAMGPQEAGEPDHSVTMGAGMGAIAPAPMAAAAPAEEKSAADEGGGERTQAPKPDLSKVSARKNLNETAFFFPHLLADADGVVKIEFTMPEALTEWKFLGFAHDRELRSGFLTDKAVTAKDLMVQPNPPRFLREGDIIEFTVKVTNQTDRAPDRQGAADVRRRPDPEIRRRRAGQHPAGPVVRHPGQGIPQLLLAADGARRLGFLTYKAVGATGRLSDGEEGYLPVLAAASW